MISMRMERHLAQTRDFSRIPAIMARNRIELVFISKHECYALNFVGIVEERTGRPRSQVEGKPL
ncbi:hypothetical protein BH23PLA1_BH23PLA1_13950 [soil metagenome]